MPLDSGKSQKTQDKNFSEMWKSYKKTGKIGNTKPRNDAHARRIITAAVKQKAGVTRRKTK